MQRLSHKQFKVCLAWLDQQWERPGIECHYLMQVAREVRATKAKDPRQVKLEDFRLKFKVAHGAKLDAETAQKLSQSKWLAAMTGPVKVVNTETGEETIRGGRNRAGKTGGPPNRGRQPVHRADSKGGGGDKQGRK